MHDTIDTQSRQPYQIAATAVFLALAIPSVLLRVWVRKYLICSMGIDDWMMVIALVCNWLIGYACQETNKLQVFFILYNAALMKIVEYGGGTHIQFGETNIILAIRVG
jgi:hypothetical protein